MTVSYPGDGDGPAPHDSASRLGPGNIVGAYRLVRLLGEGMTSRVFEVEHLRIGRRAAMKIVREDAVLMRAVKRMFAEAEAVNAIGNPHIVEITDLLVPTRQHGVHALVMELLHGTDLADLIADRKPLPLPRVLAIMAQVCDALSAVHAAGFVHRDLKPENVFLIERDSHPDFVKLLDFGLVKTISPDACSPRATVEGTFVGSPAYASPEQAAGRPVDWRTDVYATGVMLYELVSGRLPFEAESIGDVLMKQITQPAPRLPDHLLSTEVGRDLDDIVQTCLAKDPEQRGIPASQLAEAFSKLATGTTADVAVSRRPRTRASAPRGLFAIVPVAALAAAALLLAKHRPPPPQSQPAPGPAVVGASEARPMALEPPAAIPTTEPPKTSVARAARRAPRSPQLIDRVTTLNPYR